MSKKNHTYSLVYFHARARAEAIRLIFAHAGVQYQDRRFKDFVEWGAQKNGTPFHQIPVLMVDGNQLSQSRTIGRYLAKQCGVAGKSSWEQALADSVVDVLQDIFDAHVKIVYAKDEKLKAELQKTKNEVTVPKTLRNLERFVTENKASPGFLVGSGTTWADLHMVTISDYLEPGALDKFPKIAASVNFHKKLPRIAEYLKNREDTFI